MKPWRVPKICRFSVSNGDSGCRVEKLHIRVSATKLLDRWPGATKNKKSQHPPGYRD
jgi:hypothetical protein